ncbi:pilus assembly protein [Lichenihabitans sp. Uapishka_5]|uniref:TadE/TadG family type IV pilus assembly protein n=1 Tax=Lichenihabitans sp. Uapishka_5 TaxID=3037302 RepID=UPI0029E7D9AC|nr:TadE/TadG family type IV pilus assembly protein [Lichenihabitans sp. Uapishka_5]MDX7951047.1 pilus assembly protein [Lichenihabitans sp. Uapishka_5]
MPVPRLPSVRNGRVRRFLGHRRGVSAVEFALILPLALTIFAGMSEMAHAIDNWRKVTLTARTIADLTSQGDTVNPMSSATASDILASASLVLQPFPSSQVAIVMSALAVDLSASATNPRVCSSVANSNGTARATGLATDLKIPASFLQDGNRYVLAEIQMPYSPMVGSTLVNLIGGVNGSILLRSSFPWPTRGGTTYNGSTTEIIMPGGSKCP